MPREALGLAAGAAISSWVSPRALLRIAGLDLILIGLWTTTKP